MTAASDYGAGGHRILEAMRGAERYADAVFAEIVKASPTGSVLDFGAGDGVFAERFVARGVRVSCVEPDMANRGALNRLGVPVVSDIREVDSDTVDFVYTVNVLEHIGPLQETLLQVRRAMRPGAKLFVFVPAFNVLWTSLDDEVDHIQRFTRRTLTNALQAAGFTVTRTRYFDSLGFAAALGVRGLEWIGLFRYSNESVAFYDRWLFPISQIGDHFLSRLLGKNVIGEAVKAG